MVLSMSWLYWLVCRMDVSCNVLSHWPRSMMRCCARLWTSWHLKKLALLSFNQMPLGRMRRSPFRRGRGEGSNINGIQLVLKLTRVNYLEQCNVVKWNHAHPLNQKSSLSILSVVTCWWWARGCLSIFKRAIKMFLFSKYI